MHRHTRTGRDQSRDRRRLRLSRPLAAHRHHLQSQHRPARPPHSDVDRPSCAVPADHQGDAAAAHAATSVRRSREAIAARAERAARTGPSRSAGGRGGGARPTSPCRHCRAFRAHRGWRRCDCARRATDRRGAAADRGDRRVSDAAARSDAAAPSDRAARSAVRHHHDGQGPDRREPSAVARLHRARLPASAAPASCAPQISSSVSATTRSRSNTKPGSATCRCCKSTSSRPISRRQ